MISFKIIRRNFSQYKYLRYQIKDPFTRTWETLARELPAMFGSQNKPQYYPEHADVVIIGGGFIGMSVAYWLKQKAAHGLSVVVIEKDPTYASAQKNITQGTLAQHFSLPENIYLSQHSAEFLRNSKENLGPDIDVKFSPNGQLLLACEKYAEQLEQNVSIQREHGIRNDLLSPNEIKDKFPWINIQDIKLGCLGYETEGSFDSIALLQGLIGKSIEMGITYIHAEVTGFESEHQRDVLMEGIEPGSFKRLCKVIFTTPKNEEHAIKFAACILAAGHESTNVAQHAKIGTGDGLLSIPIPIEKRHENMLKQQHLTFCSLEGVEYVTKLFISSGCHLSVRFSVRPSRECTVYSVENSGKTTGLNTPLLMDTSGVWIKKGGFETNLWCGALPLLSPGTTGSADDDHINTIIKPSLINRIPQCHTAQITSIANETYDFCNYDDTGILGPHAYHNNLYIATGFGKQGCQHAPGIGRAIAELIIDGQFVSIDLTRLGFDRILTDSPLIEFNVY